MEELISWYLYEVSCSTATLNGVMLRGRIRKLGIKKSFNVLAENTEDKDNGVRFAVTNKKDGDTVTKYLKTINCDISVTLLDENLKNPVLSKLKVNIEDRYTL